jgi:hypothetical protein
MRPACVALTVYAILPTDASSPDGVGSPPMSDQTMRELYVRKPIQIIMGNPRATTEAWLPRRPSSPRNDSDSSGRDPVRDRAFRIGGSSNRGYLTSAIGNATAYSRKGYCLPTATFSPDASGANAWTCRSR